MLPIFVCHTHASITPYLYYTFSQKKKFSSQSKDSWHTNNYQQLLKSNPSNIYSAHNSLHFWYKEKISGASDHVDSCEQQALAVLWVYSHMHPPPESLLIPPPPQPLPGRKNRGLLVELLRVLYAPLEISPQHGITLFHIRLHSLIRSTTPAGLEIPEKEKTLFFLYL